MENLTQQELEQVIQYQVKSLDYMKKLLFNQIEKDKLPQVSEEDTEAINKELDYDHDQDMKLEEADGDLSNLKGEDE